LETYRRVKGLVDFIARRYQSVAEIGIGLFPDVAYALLNQRVQLLATDIRPLKHDGLKVVVDDITEPDISQYAGVNLIYSMRPPPELVPYMVRLAGKISAGLIIKPLSSEYPERFRLMRAGDTTFFEWTWENSSLTKGKSFRASPERICVRSPG
jgi:uncharacterized protein